MSDYYYNPTHYHVTAGNKCPTGHCWTNTFNAEEISEGTPCDCGMVLWKKVTCPTCKKTYVDPIPNPNFVLQSINTNEIANTIESVFLPEEVLNSREKDIIKEIYDPENDKLSILELRQKIAKQEIEKELKREFVKQNSSGNGLFVNSSFEDNAIDKGL